MHIFYENEQNMLPILMLSHIHGASKMYAFNSVAVTMPTSLKTFHNPSTVITI